MNWVWVLVAGALMVMTFTTILNMFTFPRLGRTTRQGLPVVSLLVPARNEADKIGGMIAALLAQDYPAFEVILVDDHSTDGTADHALVAARQDRRFSVLAGKPLPAGWLGKNWACHQLSQAARGDILVFTDADVEWQPGALSSLVALIEQEKAGLLSVFPTQRTCTPGERLVVPLIMLAILAYLPEFLARHTTWAAFGAANGQCMAFKRSVYLACGGHAAVKDQIVEDVTLARRVRAGRARSVIALGSDQLHCRMYRGWREVRQGFAKNILAGFGGVHFLFLSILFHWLVFLGPWLWLLLGADLPIGAGWPAVPAVLILAGLGVRALSAAIAGQRVRDAVWMPVSVALMTVISIQSIVWQITGGPRWKGRILAGGQGKIGLSGRDD